MHRTPGPGWNAGMLSKRGRWLNCWSSWRWPGHRLMLCWPRASRIPAPCWPIWRARPGYVPVAGSPCRPPTKSLPDRAENAGDRCMDCTRLHCFHSRVKALEQLGLPLIAAFLAWWIAEDCAFFCQKCGKGRYFPCVSETRRRGQSECRPGTERVQSEYSAGHFLYFLVVVRQQAGAAPALAWLPENAGKTPVTGL